MIYAEEIEFLNKIIFQAYNLGSGNKFDKNASEKVLDDMMYDYLKFRGSEFDYAVNKIAVRKKSYGTGPFPKSESEDYIIGANILQFSQINNTQEVSNDEYDMIEDEIDTIKDDLEKEIEAVNKIIASAIEHGGDSEGAYFTNATELMSDINNYMKVKGISNDYTVISMDYEFNSCKEVVLVEESKGNRFFQIVPSTTDAKVGFDKVIKAIKNGKKAKRKGWNGKEQYIELATNVSYKNTNGETVNADHKEATNCAIAFVGTSGVQLGWLASQADMLANDWIIF